MVSWARKGKEEEGGEVCTESKAEDGGWVSESEEGEISSAPEKLPNSPTWICGINLDKKSLNCSSAPSLCLSFLASPLQS